MSDCRLGRCIVNHCKQFDRLYNCVLSISQLSSQSYSATFKPGLRTDLNRDPRDQRSEVCFCSVGGDENCLCA